MQNLERHIDVWDNCLKIIEQIIEPQKFSTWFRPIRPVSLEGATLTVEVPSDFFREYLDSAFIDVLKMTLRRVLGAEAKLVYRVAAVRDARPLVVPSSNGVTPENHPVAVSSFHPGTNPGPFVYPGLQKVKINPRLNPAYSFSNLIEGECNKMGVSAGVSISAAPGKTPFNPLFIFGGPGLGKTHLAQAIGLAIKEKYPELQVLYVTGNEFKTQYVDATAVRNKLTDFMAFYQKIQVLIVDDIQDLIGQGSQSAFFNIFNYLHQNGQQLVFTSDRSPAELQNFEERLLSRFKWGLSVQLSRPDYETRLQMLRARAFREGVQVGNDVLEFLASRVTSNFRELEGTLISLVAHATLVHKDITVELAESVIGHIVGEQQQEVTIDRVGDVVCDYFKITREVLLSKSRKRQIVQARQIAMYMSRSLIPNCSLSSIGAELGGKDHATVLHACSTVSDLISTDKTFRQYVADIEQMLVPVLR